jgi:hypothetical protein
MQIAVEDQYEIGEATELRVLVEVGNLQQGAVTVRLDRKKLAEGVNSVTVAFPPTRESDLIVTAAVNDTNPDTNHTNVTVTVTGGGRKESFVADYEVPRPGQLVRYRFVLALV